MTAEPYRDGLEELAFFPSQYRLLFEKELRVHRITWCRACLQTYGRGFMNHRRGYADPKKRTIHLDREVYTRWSLFVGLHEIGHIVGHKRAGLPRSEMERLATKWAVDRMSKLNVPVPMAAIRAYIAARDRQKAYRHRVRDLRPPLPKGRFRRPGI